MARTAFVAVAAAAVMLSTAGARAAEGDALREAQDRADIEALMWRYARALDTFDAEAYAAIYTEDGQFGVGANAVKGRAALTKMVADLKKGRAERKAAGESVPGLYHMTADSHIEFVDRDHARVHTYWLTVYGAEGRDKPPRLAASGRGVDEVVRVDGQWRLKVRNVAPE
jgi:uncharacterized protein (TIGR02246 family)